MSIIVLPNGVRLELLQRDGLFLGIGEVRCGQIALRNGQRPWFAAPRTPDGVDIRDFTLREVRDIADGVRLEFGCRTQAGGGMDWMVHEVRPRVNTSDWATGPVDAPEIRFQLELRAVARRIGGRSFSGFSYQFLYESERYLLYKMLERGTWELGGHATGNEFWMRNCFVPSRVVFTSPAQFHSTEWYLPDCQNPSAFQFLPLQTELQGFTFTAAGEGILFTWSPQPWHIRSLFEKKRGIDEIEHWHEHCGDLAANFRTAPMEVLLAEGPTDEIERFNAYETVRELVHETLHREAGLRREVITTYGMIEEWGPADLVKYRERGLPMLLDAGMKRVYLANHFENNMNTYGVSNMCCTVDYRVAESVGEDKLRDFCREARAAGAGVDMWANTSISSLSPILARRQEEALEAGIDRVRFLPLKGSVMDELQESNSSFVRNPSNAIEADHYTPVFCVLNLRDEAVRDYWLKRWGYAGREIGLTGIFLDSSYNLSSDKFHWVQNTRSEVAGATADQDHLLGFYRPEKEPPAQILSQYRAHLELMAEMQKLGYHYCNEDLGVFGTHRHGPDASKRLDTLPIWSECIVNFNPVAIRKAGGDPDTVFFRGLAYRMMWLLCWDPQREELTFRYGGKRTDDDLPNPWHLRLFKAYNKAVQYRYNRRIVPGENGGGEPGAAGVSYSDADGTRTAFWAFRHHTMEFPNTTRVHELVDEVTYEVRTLDLRPHKIYVIGD